jgi:diphthamide biosynthesis protein 3
LGVPWFLSSITTAVFLLSNISSGGDALKMGAYYDEIEIEDMAWDAVKKVFHYPCPCGDRFEISRRQLRDYEDIATCPSCSLVIRIVYDPVCFFSFLFFNHLVLMGWGSLITKMMRVTRKMRTVKVRRWKPRRNRTSKNS